MKKKIVCKILFWCLFVAVLAMLGVIFFFSSQDGSETIALSDKVAKVVFDIFDIKVPSGKSPSSYPIVGNFSIRKCAHIFLFFVLGLVTFWFYCFLFKLQKYSSLADIIFVGLASFATCILCACFDELHQSFVDGRTASLNDVGIDAIGLTISTWSSTLLLVVIYAIKRVVLIKRKIAVG